MKKIFILLFATVSIFVSKRNYGQIERAPLGESSHYKVFSHTYKEPYFNFLKGATGVLFYESFEGHIGEIDQERWDIQRSSTLQGTDLEDASNPKWFLCKPESFYGNGSTYIFSGQQSAAISFTAPDFTWLIVKDPIPIAQEGNKISFWLYYRNNPTYFHLLISDIVNQQWTPLQSWENTSNNQFEEMITIEIPPQFVGSEIKIAFVHENRSNSGFQVAIDDILVGNITSPNLQIDAIPFRYSMIPQSISNLFSYTLSSYIQNLGMVYNDTSQALNAYIPSLNNFEASIAITDSLQTGERKIISLVEKPTFTQRGIYNINFFLTSINGSGDDENGDEVKNADESFSFAVTENVYATDYCTSLGIMGEYNAGVDVVFGNLYPIKGNVIAEGVEIVWSTFEEESTFQILIYRQSPVDNTINLVSQTQATKELGHSNSATIYPIDPTYLTPNTNYYIAVKQTSSIPLNVAFDRVNNGQFWRVNSQSPNQLDLLSSPSIGNVAIRLVTGTPIEEPILSFAVSDGENPMEGVIIEIEGIEPLETDEEGLASVQLSNGTYTYMITKEGYATVVDTVRIEYVNVHRNIIIEPGFLVTFVLKDENEDFIQNAEVFISNINLATNDEGEVNVTLKNGLYQYTITHPNFYPLNNELEVYKDTIVNITLTEAETVSVTFSVVNDHQYSPIPGVRVTLQNYGIKFTNSNGQVTFVGVLPTDEGLSYSYLKNGYISRSLTINEIVSDTTIVDTLSIIRYNVLVEVVDTSNTPIIGAQVVLSGSSVNTNVQGQAIFSNVVPQSGISLRVTKTGYFEHNSSVSVVDADIRRVVVLTIDPTTSPINQDQNFLIYPNPSDGNFFIQVSGIFSAEIYDISGRIIISKEELFEKHQFDITSKPAGIYFIKVTQKGTSKTFKIKKF